jgi:hypothetical protein
VIVVISKVFNCRKILADEGTEESEGFEGTLEGTVIDRYKAKPGEYPHVILVLVVRLSYLIIFIGRLTLKDLQRELRLLRAKVDHNEGRLDQTTARVENLEESVADDRAKTIMMIADHCERLDHQSNVAKSNCVLITGRKYLVIENRMFSHFN